MCRTLNVKKQSYWQNGTGGDVYMKKPYIIDACALIDAAQHYNMSKKLFAHIWAALDRLFINGELISCSEIMDKLKDEDLAKWAKERKDYFHPLTKELQEKTTEVLSQFPNLISIRGTSNSNADPFLIATALLQDGSIVTNEKLGDEQGKDYKIPNACQALGITYMNLPSFLNQILE